MDDRNSLLRNIPQIEKLLNNEEIVKFIPALGHDTVVDVIRKVTELFRKKIDQGEEFPAEKIIPSIVKNCQNKKTHKLQRVINGTGVIIHTNLGRSPLGKNILKNLADELSGYCNLEFHLHTGKRGKRGGFAEELICRLTGAEDALIVNNNASSVFLILNQFARGREAVVSRGELIQIGGGFRIPDIMEQSGAILVEVGTTNITEIEDYASAITPLTSMIFSAHRSNYKIEGFTKTPALGELSDLRNASIILVRDLGSGNLVSGASLPQPFEPLAGTELSQGADLVCFSADKLLGSCQAGIIIGKKVLIEELRKNPLMRMLRVDKVTYYIIQENLIHYQNNEIKNIPLWDILFQDKKDISARIIKIIKKVQVKGWKECLKKIETECAYGGGSLPGAVIGSYGLQIDIPGLGPEKVYSHFISHDVPIVGSIINDRYVLDFMAVFDDEVPHVTAALMNLLNTHVNQDSA